MKKILRGIIWSLFLMAFFLAAMILLIIRSNRTFTERFYTLYSHKIEESVRAVLISDLHQVSFGKENEELLSRVKELSPDIILLAGDIIHRENTDLEYVIHLCEGLMQIAPVYYGMGNHENEVLYGSDLNIEVLEAAGNLPADDPEDFTPLIQKTDFVNRLEETGVTILQNRSVEVEINGNRMEIGGISTDVSSFWPYSGRFITDFSTKERNIFKLLISHRPEPVAKYIPDYSIDLTVSGHNHGGLIRIPGKGGLISADEGWFPTCDGGKREYENMTMIISRGFTGYGLLPRINNPPELVIIDIH